MNYKYKHHQQAKKIIFVLLVLTVLSSLSAATFVTGNMNLAFAAKKHGGGSSGSSGGSGSSDSSSSKKGKGGSGGSSSSSGGSGSSDSSSSKKGKGGSGSSSSSSGGSGGGSTTTEGSDNGNSGGETGSSVTPPPSTEENNPSTPPPAETNQQTTTACPDGSPPDDKGKCPPTSTEQNTAPPAQGGQTTTTCPDGSTPDPTTGNCPSAAATTHAPNQGTTTTTTTPAAQDGGGHILVMSNPDGTCPTGSQKFPGSQVCEKDTATTTSGGGSTPTALHVNSDGTLNTLANQDGSCPQGSDHTSDPKQCKVIAQKANSDGTCPVHTSHFQGADAKQCFVDTALQTGNTGGTTTTPASQQTCPGGQTDKNGICLNSPTPLTDVKLPYNPNVGCPTGYHVHTSADTKNDECSKNGTDPVTILVETPVSADGTCPAGKQRLPTDTNPQCIERIQSTDGFCPSGTRASDTMRGECISDVFFPTTTTSTPPSDVMVPFNPNVGCPTGYHVHSGADTKVDGCSKNGTNPTWMAVFTPVSADGTCPAGNEKVNSGPDRPMCKAAVQSWDGSCPSGTKSDEKFREMCSGDVPFTGPFEIGDTPTQPTASGCDDAHGVYDPASNKCYKDNTMAPPCPGKVAANDYSKGHFVDGICSNPKTGAPQSVSVLADGTCDIGGVHIANVKQSCIFETSRLDPDGSCPTGYVPVPGGGKPYAPCRLRIHDPLKDGSCPPDYSRITLTKVCKVNTDTSSGLIVDELPAGYCPIGYTHMGTQCSTQLPVLPGSTTGPEGGFIQMLPTKPDGSTGSSGAVAVYVPANKDGSCSPGDDPSSGGYCRHKIQSTGNTAGSTGTTDGTTTTTTTPKPTTQTGTTGTGGTTTTNTGNPATTTTSPPTSTSTTTTTNVINKGGSSSGGGGGGGTTTAATSAPTPTQSASNNFLSYVNAPDKITIKYPSTWTKTELVGNPSVPVIFNAPSTTATTPAAKTSFVISVNKLTPSASNLDTFTQQQLNTLTQSQAVKYTITDTNSKILPPPNGITAFREVSYDAIKNNNVPLKGAGIFFVNGGTGYSLLYLAKQTEYTQNLPMIQQMVNSFQINGASGAGGVNNGGGPVQNVAAARGG